MVDFSKITERVFTGAAINSKEDVDTLVQNGVTHVIDARAEFDDSSIILASHPEVAYCWCPENDDGQHPKPATWFKKALDFAIPALSQPGKIIYSHCAAGVNRGPSLAFVILRAQGFSHDEAVTLMHQKRPVVNIAYKDDAELALFYLGWKR